MQLPSEHGRIFVVIAAYNEASVIGAVIEEVRSLTDNIVVVDDGSADETALVARRQGATVLIHRVNLGQGAALQTGLTCALRQSAELIVTFDADGQHSIADVSHMIETLRKSGADLAMGSRFLGTTEGMPRLRQIVLRAAVMFTRLTTGLRVSDAHNGLRVLTRHAAELIQIRQNRMAHASEILTEIRRHKLPFVEVPVHVRYTEYSMAKGQKISGAVDILLDLMNGRLLR